MESKVIFFLALIGIVASVEISDKAKEIIKECKEAHNIELEKLVQAVEKHELPTSEDGKCFMECVMEKGGVLADGKVNADRAKELSAKKLADKPDIKAKVDQVIDMCSKEVTNPGGKCNLGVKLAECAMNHSKELGIPAPKFGIQMTV
uniref:Odorant-binding protein 14 n=1 Tax=Yemma signatus TaxID=300820 RepID=A0A3G2GS03_9HEMI|nr:odorant-binding protein 14 [Yemma signatus]